MNTDGQQIAHKHISGEKGGRTELEHIRNVLSGHVSGEEILLLYVTPEGLFSGNPRLKEALVSCFKRQQLSFIAVDEAHMCKTENNFRTAYGQLGNLRYTFPNIPIMALTATAPKIVEDYVKESLKMKDAVTIKGDVTQKNIVYMVRPKPTYIKDLNADIVRFISENKYNGSKGIIYCAMKDHCDKVLEFLESKCIRAVSYYGNNPNNEESLKEWMDGNALVMVATTAFGAGIDKKDVRFVVHHSISTSLENYYQETSRAGRDGHKAHCLSYFSLADVGRYSKRVFANETGLWDLYKMAEYCMNLSKCRRVLLSEHLQAHTAPCIDWCDNCTRGSPIVRHDVSDVAEILVKWAAKNDAWPLEPGFERLPVGKMLRAAYREFRGIGGGPKKDISVDFFRLFYHLVSRGILAEVHRVSKSPYYPHEKVSTFAILGPEYEDFVADKFMILYEAIEVAEESESTEALARNERRWRNERRRAEREAECEGRKKRKSQ